jgi:hypothetical protein
MLNVITRKGTCEAAALAGGASSLGALQAIRKAQPRTAQICARSVVRVELRQPFRRIDQDTAVISLK